MQDKSVQERPASAQSEQSEFHSKKRFRLIREIVETIVLTGLLFLVIHLAVQNFNVDGYSMEPNLHDKELILVDKWSYLFHAPTRGDIVVFVAPPEPTKDYVKRLIGLPGDFITVQGTQISVNGKLLHENYVSPQRNGVQGDSSVHLIVPPHTYFVLGDNRADSYDSRSWGCVPQQNIVGRAAFIYWPLQQDNDGLLPNSTAVFNGVPAPPTRLPSDTISCPIFPQRY